MTRQHNSYHTAVAPIIATLLMVAISVVGGILIFVFTQGFFADEQVTGFKTDSLYANGYNAKDGTSEDLTSGNTISMQCPNAQLNGKLSSGDCILLFVENRGPDPLAIGEVRVFGTSYSPSENSTLADDPAGGPICDDGKKAGGSTIDDAEFRVYNSDLASNLIIKPNAAASICITYFGNDVKAGRTIPVQIVTENGQILLENVRNGGRGTPETDSGFSSLGGVQVPTGSIQTFSATASGSDEVVNLSWNALDNQGSTTRYTVSRNEGGFSSTTCVAEQTGTSCIDNTSQCGASNVYTIVAENDSGNWVAVDNTATDTDTEEVAPTVGAITYVGDPTFSGGTDGTMTFSYGATDDGNCSQSFTFLKSLSGLGAGRSLSAASTNSGSGTITGLQDGDSGTIIVTVGNGLTSGVQETKGFTYDASCDLASLNTPTNGGVTGGDGTLSVTWSTHSLVAGCTFTAFDVSVNGVSKSSSDTGSVAAFGTFSDGDAIATTMTATTEDNTPTASADNDTYDMDCSLPAITASLAVNGASPDYTASWSHTPRSGCTTNYDITGSNGAGTIATDETGTSVNFDCQTAGVGDGENFTITVTADGEDTDPSDTSGSATCNHTP